MSDPWDDPLTYCPGCGCEVDEPGLCEDCQMEELPEVPWEYE